MAVNRLDVMSNSGAVFPSYLTYSPNFPTLIIMCWYIRGELNSLGLVRAWRNAVMGLLNGPLGMCILVV